MVLYFICEVYLPLKSSVLARQKGSAILDATQNVDSDVLSTVSDEEHVLWTRPVCP